MRITPHIVVQGADRAVTFYREAFGAEEVNRIPTPDGRLMSVELRIGDSVLHIADEFPEMGVLAPPSIGGTAVVLALDVADADAVFEQAVKAGGEVLQAPQDMFWGDRHGRLDDPFGHRWSINQHQRDVPHERSSPRPPSSSASDRAELRHLGRVPPLGVWHRQAVPDPKVAECDPRVAIPLAMRFLPC